MTLRPLPSFTSSLDVRSVLLFPISVWMGASSTKVSSVIAAQTNRVHQYDIEFIEEENKNKYLDTSVYCLSGQQQGCSRCRYANKLCCADISHSKSKELIRPKDSTVVTYWEQNRKKSPNGKITQDPGPQDLSQGPRMYRLWSYGVIFDKINFVQAYKSQVANHFGLITNRLSIAFPTSKTLFLSQEESPS